MKTSNKTPRALSQELGIKLSIRDVLSFMLSLSFIVLREKEQIDEFYEDYNGF